VKKTSYITSSKEAEAVNDVRKDYFETFMPDIIKWGKVTDTSTIVDVPCGTGGMVKLLRDKGLCKFAYLVDINAAIIDAARKAVPRDAEYIVADAAQIESVVPKGVDTIICLNGFHIYIDEKEAFLEGCMQLLSSGGRLIFDVSTLGLNDDSRQYVDRHAALMRERATKLGSETTLPIDADQQLLDRYAEMAKSHNLRLMDMHYVEAMVPIARYNLATTKIPGRLRPRFPQLADDETRVKLFLDASEQAQRETQVAQVKHSRVFYVLEKS
jgi:SAM-dependent methyltransferase